MKVIQFLKVVSLAAIFVLTLSVSSWVSAANNHNLVAYQTNPTSEATNTVSTMPIDPEQPIVLTEGITAQSPLDNKDLTYRLFSFKGQANELVNITANILTGNMAMNVSVTSQSGSDIATANGTFATGFILTIKLPQDGNYQIRVDRNTPGSGDFVAGTIAVQYIDVSNITPTVVATLAETFTTHGGIFLPTPATLNPTHSDNTLPIPATLNAANGGIFLPTPATLSIVTATETK